MKIEWSTVFEFSIALFGIGLLLIAINGMFFYHMAEIGEGVHGTPHPAVK